MKTETILSVAPALQPAPLFTHMLFELPLRQCVACGTPFISPAYQAVYCSLTCRFREQKRGLRRQEKQASELHSQGMKAREIALALLGQEGEGAATNAAELRKKLASVKLWLRRPKRTRKRRSTRG